MSVSNSTNTWIGANGNVTMEISINGFGLPKTMTIHTAVIVEDAQFAVPMLNLILIDTTDSMYLSDTKIKDGSIIDFSLSYADHNVTTRKFRVAKVIPHKQRRQITYKVFCYFDSYMLYHNRTWFFGGSCLDAMQDILDNDYQKVELFENFDDSSYNTFVKYNNESYAHYLRRVLLPTFKQKNLANYFLYYHDGYTCQVMDVSTVMGEFISDPNEEINTTNYVLTPSNMIRHKMSMGNFSTTMDTGTYGAKLYQYDIDNAGYVMSSQAQTNMVANPNFDQSFKDEKILMAGMSQGNHNLDYTNALINNMRSSGLYNIHLEVELNYDCGVNGLEVIPLRLDRDSLVPFILTGKSTIFRNNAYAQHLSLRTNTVDSETVSSLFNFK